MHVATISRIPVRLHWSFFAFVAGYGLWAAWGGGIGEGISALLVIFALFGSVLLHELGHAMAARHYGIDTAHITLFPFGGVAAITEMPSIPRQEFVIALAGPAVNFALVAVFGAAWAVFGGWPLMVLVAINLLMGAFNLIPAFPMDGGRVLRALLSRKMGFLPASAMSMRIGSVFGWLFLAIGLVAWLPSLILVGGFLLVAIRMERARLDDLLRRGWRPGMRAGFAEPPRTSATSWRLSPES